MGGQFLKLRHDVVSPVPAGCFSFLDDVPDGLKVKVFNDMDWWGKTFAKVVNTYYTDRGLETVVEFVFRGVVVDFSRNGKVKLFPLASSWMYARMFGVVGESWVCWRSRGWSSAERNVLSLMNRLWNGYLFDVLNSGTSAVAVWRADREHFSDMPLTVWDVLEDDRYMLPRIRSKVSGSVNSKGQQFVWLLGVMPSIFNDLKKVPVGGLGNLFKVDVSFSQVLCMNNPWQDLWVKNSDGSWAALEALFGLQGGLHPMGEHAVIGLAVSKMGNLWKQVLFPA